MHLISVIGARPHYMKVAPLHRELVGREIRHDLVHTGQHYDDALTKVYEQEFNLPPAKINLTTGSVSPGLQIGNMIIKLNELFQEQKPDVVLVYGDTNSTAAAAIAAVKNNIPVAHVEAGLREFRKDVPEEINKLLVDAVSELFFCPTQSAANQLIIEGKTEGVYVTGDIVYDLIHNDESQLMSVDTILTNKLRDKPFYFVTIHRQSNTTDQTRLKNIVECLLALEHQVVFSVHPRTKEALKRFGLWEAIQIPRIYTLESRPFWETQWLIANAKLTLTDSGGISKESFFHGTGCILLDDQIEWGELVTTGWIKISSPVDNNIVDSVMSYERPTVKPSNVFGDGLASKIMVDAIIKYHASRK